MKIRSGFVSNSSSSSFVLSLSEITPAQYLAIMNNKYDDQPYSNVGDAWDIEVTETEIRGSTFMDNYSMSEFFEKIGVDDSKVKWDE